MNSNRSTEVRHFVKPMLCTGLRITNEAILITQMIDLWCRLKIVKCSKLEHNDCAAAQKVLRKHHKKLKIMKIMKITIIPRDCDTDRRQLEEVRKKLKIQFAGEVYFETSGETVAENIIEKELKPAK